MLKKLKQKIKLMDQLFKLWQLINSPSTSAAWRLNKIDFVKTVVHVILIGEVPLAVAQLGPQLDGQLNFTVLGTVAVGGLIAGITLAASKHNNSTPTK